MLEKADDIRQLLQRNFRIDPRRILQVLPRRRQNRRHLLLARNQRPQPLVHRRKIALHQHERAVRDPPRIGVGILLPTPNSLQLELVPPNVVADNGKVALGALVQAVRGKCVEFPLVSPQSGDLRLNARAAVVLQLRVVLVEAQLGSAGRPEVKYHVGKVMIGQRAESRASIGSFGIDGWGCRHQAKTGQENCGEFPFH